MLTISWFEAHRILQPCEHLPSLNWTKEENKMVNLSAEYLGLKLKNPIIVGSSGLTSSVEKIKDIEAKGAGAVVLKSIFEEEVALEYMDFLKTAKKVGKG
jgi:hypothetical protein